MKGRSEGVVCKWLENGARRNEEKEEDRIREEEDEEKWEKLRRDEQSDCEWGWGVKKGRKERWEGGEKEENEVWVGR